MVCRRQKLSTRIGYAVRLERLDLRIPGALKIRSKETAI
jgi:hypothetical protein